MKKLTVILSLLLAVCLLSGCTPFAGAVIGRLLAEQAAPASASTPAPADPDATLAPLIAGTPVDPAAKVQGDTVTISREQYEKYQKFDKVIELMDYAEAYYYQDVDETALLDGAAQGLMSGLGDYYSFYYNPEDFAEMWEDDEGEYAGVGIQITASYITGICTISRVFDNGPALEAGVQKGDILYLVEDLTVDAWNLQEAVDIMRGTPGTDVNVTFLRNGEEMHYVLTRANITVNQIESMMLEDKIGYIALYQFSGDCANEFDQHLKGLLAQGAEGIILDLRDNPGGWVEDARAIGDLFLDAGDLCYLVYKGGYEAHEYKTRDGKADVKLVVLVNENSASSSEILTGALQDRADATVVGTQSFGKGIVQVVNYVGDDGSGFQMTVAQYFTPNGNAVHQIGITPDVVVELAEDDNGMYRFGDLSDPQLSKALEIMREKTR